MPTLVAAVVAALFAVVPAQALDATLLTYSMPSGARVDVATDPSCALQGVCDDATGTCSAGLVGTACQAASDCAGRLNTCRVVFQTTTPGVTVTARIDGTALDVPSPLPVGTPVAIDVPLDARRRRNRLRLLASATIDGSELRERRVFRFTPVPNIRYRPMPAHFGVPAEEARLLDAVAAADRRAIREHAWAIWAGLTARTFERFNGKRLPVFETWFSGTELYDARPYACDDVDLRPFARNFEKPAQLHHHGGSLPNEQVTGFNRFNRATVQHVCSHQYNLAATLDALNASFTPATPVGAREIVPFPREAMALKPVFTAIKQSGITVLPYWAGPTASTNLTNPTPDTWTQCVAVVPPGTVAPASPTDCICNGTPRTCEVVTLDRMYAFKLTAAEVADMASDSSLAGGPLEEGDWAALMAMHTTSKEIDRWTWQTFWWTPTPDASPDGDFRPDAVRREFRNYAMCTAWSMNGPPESETGTPEVCFNPWLETGLQGIDGVQSNCMTCHQLAAWPNFSTPYQANGFVSPDDAALFGSSLRVDFLWSVTRAQ